MSFDLQSISKKYFKTFSDKNVDELSDMFADDICLQDWEIRAVGKAAVLLANENIFSSVETIEATPTSLYCENNVVVAELKICIDNKTSILVVDVIEFDKSGKIKAIRAYKGN